MSDFDIRYASIRRSVIEREFENLNEKQREAVFATEGPLLLLAGAGSGKTTVLINRIINLLRFGSACESATAPAWAGEDELRALALALSGEGSLADEELVRLCAVNPPKPYEVIAITFTNKAANELKERLHVACGPVANDVWAHTFHSACTRILRREIGRLGYTSDFTIYDDDDRKKVIASVFKELNLDEKRYEIKAFMGEISRAKDSLLDAAAYHDMAGDDYYKKIVARVYDVYEMRMKTANALDFDDIIVKTVELLREFEDVREKYQKRFKYVLVDEYQDTNHAQYALCRLLAGGHENLCVVGDDDQSIYKFRGATIENILQFEKQYPRARTIRLEQNYRSTSTILTSANGVIANNAGRKGKTLWTQNEEGEPLHLFFGETQEEEAQFIAQRIRSAHANGEKLNSFTVLYRNHALSNNIETAFKRSSIPYRIVSGLRFFDRLEVKDMLAYLWVLYNPHDTVRLRRIINNPPRHIGAGALGALTLHAQEHGVSEFSVAERAGEYPGLHKFAPALTAFATLIDRLRGLVDQVPLSELYDELLERSGYLAALRQKGDAEALGRIENILELKSTIAAFCAHNAEATLGAFLEEISLFTDIDRYDAEADSVTMMTIHSAKGLEFDTVFLCGAEEGIFPSFRSLESEIEIEEERRLCYVAMTRAKKRLFVTGAKRRMLYGQSSYAKPSRFVAEIPAECIAAPPAPAARPQTYRKIGFTPTKDQDVSVTRSTASTDVQRIRPGESIAHKAFGDGIVVAATPMGGDVLLEIMFDKIGTKLMMLKTASPYITKR